MSDGPQPVAAQPPKQKKERKPRQRKEPKKPPIQRTPRLKAACRMCLKKEHPTMFVPVEARTLDEKTIADKMYELSDIKINADQHLSQLICCECTQKLESAYQIRKQIIETNAILVEEYNASLVAKDPITGEPLESTIVIRETVVAEAAPVENGTAPVSTDVECDEPFEMMMADDHDSDSIDIQDIKVEMEDECDIPLQTTASAPGGLSNGEINLKRIKFWSLVRSFINSKDGLHFCKLDEALECTFALKEFNNREFLHHFLFAHQDVALKKGLTSEVEDDLDGPASKRKKMEVKRMDRKAVLKACIKLVALHNVPIECFGWTAFRILLSVFGETSSIAFNADSMLTHLKSAVRFSVDELKKELSGRLVSIKIDSVCLNCRQVLVVSAHYELDSSVVTRPLQFIEVQPNQPFKNLLINLQSIFFRYDLSAHQIYTIVWDEAASMIVSSKKLRKLNASALPVASIQDEHEIDINDQLLTEETTETLYSELSAQYLTIRGALHYLDQAISEVLKDDEPSVALIADFVQNLRDTKYREFIGAQEFKIPSSWSQLRWYDKCKTIHFIVKQEALVLTLSSKFPELALGTSTWQLVKDFEAAFQPLREMIKLVQNAHQPFSEFYMQKLVAIRSLRGLTDNPFAKALVESLTKLLTTFKENMVWNASLFLDPRFHYLKSIVFTTEQKEAIQNFIISTWNQLNKAKPTETDGSSTEPIVVPDSNSKDDMDDFFAEMFGGSLDNSRVLVEANPQLLQQLKALEIEPKQPRTFDVWRHWTQRRDSHPELAQVALVILAAPTNHVSWEAAAAPFLVSDQAIKGCPPETMEDIVFLKQNQPVFDRALQNLYDWMRANQTSVF